MKVYICNAFSLSMLDRATQDSHWEDPSVRRPSPLKDPIQILKMLELISFNENQKFEIISAVGHKDTARIISSILNMELKENRISIRLRGYNNDPNSDVALIAQIVKSDGSPYRLLPGATELPADAVIEWWYI